MVNPSRTSDAVGEFIELYSDSLVGDSVEVVFGQEDTISIYCDWVGYQVFARDTMSFLYPHVPIRSINLPSLVNSKSFSITLRFKGPVETNENRYLDSVWVPISTDAGFSWQRMNRESVFEKSKIIGLTGDYESMGGMAQVTSELEAYKNLINLSWSEASARINLEEGIKEKDLLIFIDNDLDGKADFKLDSVLSYNSSELKATQEFDLVNHWIRIGLVEDGRVEFYSFCDPEYVECGPLSISQIYPFTENDETEWIEWSIIGSNYSNAPASLVLKKGESDSIMFSVSDLGGGKSGKKVSVSDSLRFRSRYGSIRLEINEFDKWLSLNNSGGVLGLNLDGTQLGSWSWEAIADSSRGRVHSCDSVACRPSESSNPGQIINRLPRWEGCELFSSMMNNSNSLLIVEVEGSEEKLKLVSSVGKLYAEFEVSSGSSRIVTDLGSLDLIKGRYYLKNSSCFKTIYWGF